MLTQNEEAPQFSSLEELNRFLKRNNCRRCNLGFQENIYGCCVSRGDMSSKMMVIAEGPGEEEDKQRRPLVGPAGRLFDRIWSSVGLDTNDWYLTNTVLCRSVALPGSGKKNLPPTAEQKRKCSPYMWQQIQLLNPEIIVTLGRHATAAIVKKSTVKMGDYRGKLITSGRFLVYPMIHPSALLQTKRDPDRHNMYRRQMWTDIQHLRKLLEERNII